MNKEWSIIETFILLFNFSFHFAWESHPKLLFFILLYEREESFISVWLDLCPPHNFCHVTLKLTQFCSRHSFEVVFGMFPCSLDSICVDFNYFTCFFINLRLFESVFMYNGEMFKSKTVEGAICGPPITIDGAAWGTVPLDNGQ